MKEEVYIVQPEGFIIEGEEDKVYKLRKALYGLRQAPIAWYSHIDHHFHQPGLMRSQNELTVYQKQSGSLNILLLYLYVDIIYMSFSEEMLAEFKENMIRTFKMSDLSPLRYLGLQVKQIVDLCMHPNKNTQIS